MPALPTYGARPVVLLTNDDGPPSESSPNIYAFAKHLGQKFGWDVRVVIPDSQKSWVGKGYAIQSIVEVKYFYPLEPDGRQGEVATTRRPLKDNESMEWVLISSTPAACTNLALHNLYPGEIDLVISGPNHGRNSSTAFALSSGTVGAALAAAFSVPVPGPPGAESLHSETMPSIAVSYGVVKRPVSHATLDLAHDVAADVCKRLFDDWGYEDDDTKRPVQVYSVNVPLVPEVLTVENRKTCFTHMYRNTYGQLFKPTTKQSGAWNPADVDDANPDADVEGDGALRFAFAPNLHPILFPETLPEGTDAWAFHHGYTSVTPFRAAYDGLSDTGSGFGSGHPDGPFW